MFRRLVLTSLQNRLPVLLAAALVLAAGTWTAFRLPVDVFPDLTAPTVTVLAEAHGMAPEDVEGLVTFPLEAAMNGASGVRRVRSSTAQGIAVVWVEFDWGTDIFRARQIVTEKLQTVAPSLPPDLPRPVLAPISSIMGEIMMIGLTGPQSPRELRTVADWTVRRRLLALRGVSQVVPIGGEAKEYQVRPDPARLRATEVGLREVVRAAEGANRNAAGGLYRDRGQEYVIRGIGRTRDVEALAQTVVAVRDGIPVLLGQVADVTTGNAPKVGDGSVNATAGVVLSVQKQPGANTLDLTERIEAELASIQEKLPEGMTLHEDLFRQSSFIRLAVSNVLEALRDGALLVVVILLLFLGDLRATSISVLAIPLSLAVAIGGMALFGVGVNTMTLGGMAIAVGALVDDAIIFVENVFRRLKENHHRPPGSRRPVLPLVYDASGEILGSIVNATLIIVVVFVPLFFLSGLEGRLVRPLGFAYAISVLASLLVAVTVTPALCATLLPQAPAVRAERESFVTRHLKAGYSALLERVLRRPLVVLGGAGAALAGALAVVPLLGTAFLPEFNEGALTVSVVTVPGTSLDEANAIGRRVERILLEDPSVENVDRRQGRAELAEHAQGVNAAEIDATLRPGNEKAETLERLREAVAGLPGTSVTLGQPISHRIDHMLSGTRANIAVKIFGPELRELRRLGGRVRDAMAGVEGVVDLQLEKQAEVPQLRIEADRPALARFGMTPGDLAEAVDVAFGGKTVSRVLEGGHAFDLVVRLPPELRSSERAIAGVSLATPTGERVRLSELARVTVDRGPNRISREDVQRKIVVQANVAGRDLGSTVSAVQERVAGAVELPPRYHLEYGGQFESQERATRRIAVLSAFAVLLIFLLLFREFGSARLAALVMANLPLALIGGVAAVLVTDRVVSIASLVGFVTLFGIATRNGVLLVAHYERLRTDGLPLREAVTRGSLERLAPILMTALTAGLALIPLALGAGEPGKEIQSPLAAVVLGGLLSATALNMIVLPVLYERFAARSADAPSGL